MEDDKEIVRVSKKQRLLPREETDARDKQELVCVNVGHEENQNLIGEELGSTDLSKFPFIPVKKQGE